MLNEYLQKHPNLCNKIEKRTGIIYGLKDDTAQESSMEPECDDNADVPSSTIIQDALGLAVPGANLESICITQVQKVSGRLVVGGDSEDVWAWNNGERWGDDLPVDNGDD